LLASSLIDLSTHFQVGIDAGEFAFPVRSSPGAEADIGKRIRSIP
jgi:hypothetical protein